MGVVSTLPAARGGRGSNNVNSIIEIRRYEPYSVCTVSMSSDKKRKKKKKSSTTTTTDRKLGAPELSGASAFGSLAGYLFGKNEQSTVMKMTTPVQTSMTSTEEQKKEGEEIAVDNDRRIAKTMEFVLPSEYWGAGKLKS